MTLASFRRMANVNGEITPLEDARISILDRGFLYGDSVYEVFRTYSGVPLFCHEHFDRMENSARLIPHDDLAVARGNAGGDAADRGRGERAEGRGHLRALARHTRHRGARPGAGRRSSQQLRDHCQGSAEVESGVLFAAACGWP